MKKLTKVIIATLIFGFLLTPAVFAANDSENTDPDLSNNEASVSVEPYSVSENDSDDADEEVETVSMQPTGVPIFLALLALFMMLTGFLTGKNN